MNAFTALKSVLIGCGVLLAVVITLLVYEMTISPQKPVKHKRKTKHSVSSSATDDEDEYISIAPTMTVKQIVNAYTLHTQEAEQKYTNKPMNVTGMITKITSGKTHSHVELDEMLICVCPKGSVKTLRPLQKVCITGTLRGKLLLDNCVMVKRPV